MQILLYLYVFVQKVEHRHAKALAKLALIRNISALQYAPVAQLDRVAGSDPVGRGFESLQARHTSQSYLI